MACRAVAAEAACLRTLCFGAAAFTVPPRARDAPASLIRSGLRRQFEHRSAAAFAAHGRDAEEIARGIFNYARGILAIRAVGLCAETVERRQRLALQPKQGAALLSAAKQGGAEKISAGVHGELA